MVKLVSGSVNQFYLTIFLLGIIWFNLKKKINYGRWRDKKVGKNCSQITRLLDERENNNITTIIHVYGYYNKNKLYWKWLVDSKPSWMLMSTKKRKCTNGLSSSLDILMSIAELLLTLICVLFSIDAMYYAVELMRLLCTGAIRFTARNKFLRLTEAMTGNLLLYMINIIIYFG